MDKTEHLFDGETLVYSAQGDLKNLYVTNKRVICAKRSGKALNDLTIFKDISIRHISSIEWKTITYPWALLFGIILIIGGFAMLNFENNIPTIILVTIGAISILVCIFMKKSALILITESEKIPLTFGGYDAGKNVSEMTKIIREMAAKNE